MLFPYILMFQLFNLALIVNYCIPRLLYTYYIIFYRRAVKYIFIINELQLRTNEAYLFLLPLRSRNFFVASIKHLEFQKQTPRCR